MLSGEQFIFNSQICLKGTGRKNTPKQLKEYIVIYDILQGNKLSVILNHMLELVNFCVRLKFSVNQNI